MAAIGTPGARLAEAEVSAPEAVKEVFEAGAFRHGPCVSPEHNPQMPAMR